MGIDSFSHMSDSQWPVALIISDHMSTSPAQSLECIVRLLIVIRQVQ